MSGTDNVREAIPFFVVHDMQASLRFYVQGLGFALTDKWEPDGNIRWCQVRRGGAALMLQDRWRKEGSLPPLEGKIAQGVSIMLISRDALAIYHEVTARGIQASKPFVSNGMWVTSVEDPDGYRLEFESFTDVPEGTRYTGDSSVS